MAQHVLSTHLPASGGLRLIDFGIAGQELDARDTGVGTLRYSAPEQIGVLQRVVDGRADLYALGCVMFECVTGQCPFRADNLSDLLHQHAAVRPERADAIEPRCPAALADIIDRLLQKDTDERYDSAWRLLGELRRLVPTRALPSLRPRESAVEDNTVVELVGTGGARMRLDITGTSRVDVVALAQAFWSRER